MDKIPGPHDFLVEWFEEWKNRDIKDQVINDGNAYYVDDEAIPLQSSAPEEG